MRLKMYQVDAFASELFSGNPAAVVPLEEWPGEELMQKIANENNLSETAFYVKANEQYELRWFTPEAEVDLCGHATLASAFVIFNFGESGRDRIDFFSPRSGDLTVTKSGDRLDLTFPSDDFKEVPITEELSNCFKERPIAAFKGKTDYMLVYENEDQITDARPNLANINSLDARGVIITSEGKDYDFVSRFFAPKVGVNEDPVTGSAHTTLVPFWSKKLGKSTLRAKQLSKRTGILWCGDLKGKVRIGGHAKLFFTAEIFLP